MQYKLSLLLLLVIIFINGSAQITKLTAGRNYTYGIATSTTAYLFSQDSIFTTNGTPSGTNKLTSKVSLANFIDYDYPFRLALNNKLVFTGKTVSHGIELWTSDGTDAGTVLLKDINPDTASSRPSVVGFINNHLYFFANNGIHGRELWKTDGTQAGTVMVKDINVGLAGSDPDDEYEISTTFNNYLYFTAFHPTSGIELWRTDGTTAGTTLVVDLTPGIGNTYYEAFEGISNTSSLIMSVIEVEPGDGSYNLYKLNTSNLEHQLLKDFGPESSTLTDKLVAFQNKVYFIGPDKSLGAELWVTDGTVAGTELVKDIWPGIHSGWPILSQSFIIGNTLYFPATDPINGTELWMTNGTTTGTTILKDIHVGSNSSNPFPLDDFYFHNNQSSLVNGKIFFTADNGLNGEELWITDGTPGGTMMVKDIRPGLVGSNISDFRSTSSGLIFSGDDGNHGHEIWFSDGTAAGTSLLADVNTGITGSFPRFHFFYNNQLYFTAIEGNALAARNFYKLDNTLTPLPLFLLTFSATQLNQDVQLYWKVGQQVNVEGYIIERSVNGIDYFKIGNVNARNNSTVLNYSFTDYNASALPTQNIYYRLKFNNHDGTSNYSPTVKIALKDQGQLITLFPNPVHDYISLSFTPPKERFSIRIVDATGKRVFEKRYEAQISFVNENITVSHLQKGIFFIQIISPSGKQSLKFIKE